MDAANVSEAADADGGPRLRTPRLLLRRWRAEDLEPFAALNADPEVMEHFPAPLSRAASAEEIDAIEGDFRAHGVGFWAVELPGEAPLIGFVGLRPVPPQLPFAPAVEVGWRLARPYWKRGLAAEGASAAIDYGFGPLDLSDIVAYTAARNERSRRLMERLGMTRRDREDFLYPGLPSGHQLAPHVLYRLRRAPA